MSSKEKVTRVVDGDTFHTNGRRMAVRLAGVDAPELGTPGGSAAKTKLQGLIGGKEVSVTPVARDKYRRTVANVLVGRRSVNRAMGRK